ncbi:hypothetical protein JTB14_031056 [Gonioctena quinquepunctata]|nr:hypothetical protein JTB14_031056 [Gonioctena quinquepunctata]
MNESVASIRRANGALFLGATEALISWDPPSSAVDPSTLEPCHTAEGVSEMEAHLEPEDVILTEFNQDSLPTGYSRESGSQDEIGSPDTLRKIEGQKD